MKFLKDLIKGFGVNKMEKFIIVVIKVVLIIDIIVKNFDCMVNENIVKIIYKISFRDGDI